VGVVLKDMLKIVFIKLLKKVNHTLNDMYTDTLYTEKISKDTVQYPIFMGETFDKLLPRVKKCFQEIIDIFKSESGVMICKKMETK